MTSEKKYPNQREPPILAEVPRSPGKKSEGHSFFRVLRVWEYELIREAAGSVEKRTKLDALLLTGMRYVELQRLYNHDVKVVKLDPEKMWFHEKQRVIFLPSEATKKPRRKQVSRYVRLSDMGVVVLPHYFETNNLPSWDAWHDNLVRWALKAGLDPAWLSPKTTRKTWESWLVYCFPNRFPEIMLSQGHTSQTALHHYLNLPFTSEDRQAMERYVRGWGT